MCHFNGVTIQLQQNLEEWCHKAKLGVWGDLKEACLLKTPCLTCRVWKKGATKQSLECGVTLKKPDTKQSLESGVTLKKPAFSKYFVQQEEFGGWVSKNKAQSVG